MSSTLKTVGDLLYRGAMYVPSRAWGMAQNAATRVGQRAIDSAAVKMQTFVDDQFATMTGNTPADLALQQRTRQEAFGIQRQFESLTHTTTREIPLPQDLSRGIRDQATILKDNLFQLAIAQLLSSACGLTQDSASKISSSELTINQTDLGYVKKLWAKFCLWVCIPIFKFYIEGTVDNVLHDALRWIDSGKVERQKDLDAFISSPSFKLLNEISSIYSTYARTVSEKPRTPNEIIEQKIASKKTHTVIRALTAVILNRYVPSLKGTRYFMFQPIAKLILRRLIATQIIPAVYQSTKQAAGVGGCYLHSLNQFVLKKLLEIKQQLQTGHSAALQSQCIPVESQTKIQNLVEALFDVLDWQGYEGSLGSWGSTDESQRGRKKLAMLPVRMAVANELSKLIGTANQRLFLQELLYTSLSNLNDSFNPAQHIPLEEMEETQKRMFGELRGLIETAVNKAIEQTLSPAAANQAAADTFVATVKHLIEAFKNAASETDDTASIERLFNQLVSDLQSLTTAFKVDDPTHLELLKVQREVQKHLQTVRAALNHFKVDASNRELWERAISEFSQWATDLQPLKAPLPDGKVRQLAQFVVEGPAHALYDNALAEYPKQLIAFISRGYYWDAFAEKILGTIIHA